MCVCICVSVFTETSLDETILQFDSRLVKYIQMGRERDRGNFSHFTLAYIIHEGGAFIYLQELRMRISFHLSGTRAQNIRDRFPAFRLVQLLHGTFVEQEDRDLLQTSNPAIISHVLFSIIARIYLRNEARMVSFFVRIRNRTNLSRSHA